MPGISQTYLARLSAAVQSGQGMPYLHLGLIELGPYARKGYGTQLVKALQAMARAEQLEIRLTSVDGALTFWQKCGFVRDERFPENGSGTPMVWRAI